MATSHISGQRYFKVTRRRSSLDDVPSGPLTLQRGEPADAFVTGTTRSLQRRVLGLNFPASEVNSASDPAAVTAPAYQADSRKAG